MAEKRSAGRRGEIKCASFIERRFAGDENTYVFHDVDTPGMRANLDHVVVRGRTAVVVDAKCWAPGFYWTAGGVTRRGVRPVPHADSETLPATVLSLSRAASAHAGFDLDIRALLVVVPSQPKRLSVLAYRPAGGVPVRTIGPGAMRVLSRMLGTDRARCDPLVDLLWNLTRNRESRRAM